MANIEENVQATLEKYDEKTGLITVDGSGTKYLADDGKYKEISGSGGSLQNLKVNITDPTTEIYDYFELVLETTLTNDVDRVNAQISCSLKFAINSGVILADETYFLVVNSHVAVDIRVNGTRIYTKSVELQRTGRNQSIELTTFSDLKAGDVISIRILPNMPYGDNKTLHFIYSATDNIIAIS